MSHLELNGFVFFWSGPAPFLQMWEICLVGAMTVPADSYANEGFRVKPMAG